MSWLLKHFLVSFLEVDVQQGFCDWFLQREIISLIASHMIMQGTLTKNITLRINSMDLQINQIK